MAQARKKVYGGTNQKPIEQYEHKDKKRLNNPPVGLVDEGTEPYKSPAKTYQYDPHIDPQLQFDSNRVEVEKIIDEGLNAASFQPKSLEEAESVLAFVKDELSKLKKLQQPYLNWAGKAEHTSFEVPTVSLHVHERIDPRRIIESVKKEDKTDAWQPSLFETEKKPLREAIEFYKHKNNWSNRLIAGDSLLVMNSLLEKEGMGGKVQMMYFDPPYGIKYGSNFQPFINDTALKSSDSDGDLTAEPEMLKAFRDTWELGIHSYLTYLRDRLLLSFDLLHDSGSVFVQISEENLHRVRIVMDEIFGDKNFVAVITVKKASVMFSKKLLNSASFYILWYTKNKENIKYRQLFTEKDVQWFADNAGSHLWVENIKTKENRKVTPAERNDIEEFLKQNSGFRIFGTWSLNAQGTEKQEAYKYEGRDYYPPKGTQWKTSYPDGLDKLSKENRLQVEGNNLRVRLYPEDYPVMAINNLWDKIGAASNKIYVVQTSEELPKRCMLMSTDPGDLVLDITCGSGTTAVVAENWGRRWIPCDTSRISIALAKQRLMTSNFDFFEMAYPKEGVGSGFKYKSVPHVTLGSIANNEISQEEILYDQPLTDSKRQRVTGPFTLEAVPAPVAKSFEEFEFENSFEADISVSRSGETLRQDEWRNELLRTGVRAKGNKMIEFSRVEPLSGTRFLQAEAETKPFDSAQGDKVQRVVVCFGPEHAPLEQRMVELALEEARTLKPKPEIVLFCAFQFDPEARKDIEETNWPGITLLEAQMNADLLTDDLKKKRSSNESFWLIGQPDVQIKELKSEENKGKYVVEVLGFDYYNPKTGKIDSGGKGDIAMWMLDHDYDGRSLFPSQVFFPMAGAKEGWATLARNLKAEIDEEKIEAFRGTISLPFKPGREIAVKIIDARGIESLKIIRL